MSGSKLIPCSTANIASSRSSSVEITIGSDGVFCAQGGVSKYTLSWLLESPLNVGSLSELESCSLNLDFFAAGSDSNFCVYMKY